MAGASQCLLPTRKAIKEFVLSSSELVSFNSLCLEVSRVGLSWVVPRFPAGALVLLEDLHIPGKVIARRAYGLEGPYVTVGDKWGSDTNATTSVPLAQVLDRKPTAAEWAAVEAEACSQLLQGLGEHLTFHEVQHVLTRLAQLNSCRLVLQQAQAQQQPQNDRQPHGCMWAAKHGLSPARPTLNPGTSALDRAALRDKLLSLFCSPMYPEHVWAAFAAQLQPWDESEAMRLATGANGPGYPSVPPQMEQLQQHEMQGACGLEQQEGQQSTGGCPSGVAADAGGAGGGLLSNSSTCYSLSGVQEEEEQPGAEQPAALAEVVEMEVKAVEDAEDNKEVDDGLRAGPAPAEAAVEACAAECGTEGWAHGAGDGFEDAGRAIAAVASSRGLEGPCSDRCRGPEALEGASAGHGGRPSEEAGWARKRRRLGSSRDAGHGAGVRAGSGGTTAGQAAGHMSSLPIASYAAAAAAAAAAASAPASVSPRTGAGQGRKGSSEGAGRGLQSLGEGPQAGGPACGPSVSEAVPGRCRSGPLQHDVDPQLPSIPSVPTLPGPNLPDLVAVHPSASDAQPASVPSSPHARPSPESQTRPPSPSATPQGPPASAPDSQPSTVQRRRLRPAAPSPFPTPPVTSTSKLLPSSAVRFLPTDLQEDQEPQAAHHHHHHHEHQHQHQRQKTLPLLSPVEPSWSPVEPSYSPPHDADPAPPPAPPPKQRQLRPLPPAPSIVDTHHHKPPAGLHLDGGSTRASSPRPRAGNAAAKGADERKKEGRRGTQRPSTRRPDATKSAGAAIRAAAVAAGEAAQVTSQPEPPAGPAFADAAQQGVEQAVLSGQPADPKCQQQQQQQQQQERAEEDAGKVLEAHRRQARKRSRSRCRNPAPAPDPPQPPRREAPKSLEEWSERVMAELAQRPGYTATLTQLESVGLGIPRHLAPNQSPGAFLRNFRHLWHVSDDSPLALTVKGQHRPREPQQQQQEGVAPDGSRPRSRSRGRSASRNRDRSGSRGRSRSRDGAGSRGRSRGRSASRDGEPGIGGITREEWADSVHAFLMEQPGGCASYEVLMRRGLVPPPTHLLEGGGWRSLTGFLKFFRTLWEVSPVKPLVLTATAHLHGGRARSRSRGRSPGGDRSRSRAASRGRSASRGGEPESDMTDEEWAISVVNFLLTQPGWSATYDDIRRWGFAAPRHLLDAWPTRIRFLKSFRSLWDVSRDEPLTLTLHPHLDGGRARSRSRGRSPGGDRSRSRGRPASRGRSTSRGGEPCSGMTREKWADGVVQFLITQPGLSARYEEEIMQHGLAASRALLSGWPSRVSFLKSFPELWSVGDHFTLTAHPHLAASRARSRSRGRSPGGDRSRSRGRSRPMAEGRERSVSRGREPGLGVLREEWANIVLEFLRTQPGLSAPYDELRRRGLAAPRLLLDPWPTRVSFLKSFSKLWSVGENFTLTAHPHLAASRARSRSRGRSPGGARHRSLSPRRGRSRGRGLASEERSRSRGPGYRERQLPADANAGALDAAATITAWQTEQQQPAEAVAVVLEPSPWRGRTSGRGDSRERHAGRSRRRSRSGSREGGTRSPERPVRRMDEHLWAAACQGAPSSGGGNPDCNTFGASAKGKRLVPPPVLELPTNPRVAAGPGALASLGGLASSGGGGPAPETPAVQPPPALAPTPSCNQQLRGAASSPTAAGDQDRRPQPRYLDDHHQQQKRQRRHDGDRVWSSGAGASSAPAPGNGGTGAPSMDDEVQAFCHRVYRFLWEQPGAAATTSTLCKNGFVVPDYILRALGVRPAGFYKRHKKLWRVSVVGEMQLTAIPGALPV